MFQFSVHKCWEGLRQARCDHKLVIGFWDNGPKTVFLNPWRVKIPWFQSSKLCNFWCLSRGFLTGWIDSWSLFYSGVIGFRVMDQNVLDGHCKGSKSKIFKIFELNHVRCLYRGFLTRWIDSWCLFYSRMIGFCDNGPKPVFLNPRWGQNTMVSKF